MKKILCIALCAFGAMVQAQNIESVINNNPAIKTIQDNAGLSLTEKMEVVNRELENGRITEEQAGQIISWFSAREGEIEDVLKIEAEVVETGETYDFDWGKEQNPFDFAMGVETDTVPKYRRRGMLYFSAGMGNVATDGAFANSEFGYLRSNSVEWGIAFRSPFSKHDNKWGIRYGLGFRYSGLATTQNQEFVLNGNETITAPSGESLRNNSAYLRNTYINIPISLDFTTTTKTYNSANRRFNTKEGFNFGLGGYIGYNINSKQMLHYENANGYKIRERQKGNWNVTDFQYGLMVYAGTDLYKIVAKYDLNPFFKDNPVNQNYWSIGLHLGL